MESLDLESARRRREEAFLMLDKGISWAETLSLGAWARLTLPLLRPPPASPCHARPLEACGASFRVDSIAMESLDLESARRRREEAFLMLDKGISWAETLSLGAWARLTLPLLRPPPARRSSPMFSRKIASFVRRLSGDAPHRFLCLPCAPARGVRCFLSCGFDCHGVLGPGECRGAREKLF